MQAATLCTEKNICNLRITAYTLKNILQLKPIYKYRLKKAFKTFKKGKKQNKKECMSVPSCKGTLFQGHGKPWYRGYCTTQEQRTRLYGQPPSVVQTTI